MNLKNLLSRGLELKSCANIFFNKNPSKIEFIAQKITMVNALKAKIERKFLTMPFALFELSSLHLLSNF